MPYSAELRDELLGRGVEYFLSKYKVLSQAGGGNQTALTHDGIGTPQRISQQLGGFDGPLGGPPVPGAPTQAQDQALLAAPVTHAYFVKTGFAPAPPAGVRRTSVFLKDTVRFYFDTESPVGRVDGLPVYLRREIKE